MHLARFGTVPETIPLAKRCAWLNSPPCSKNDRFCESPVFLVFFFKLTPTYSTLFARSLLSCFVENAPRFARRSSHKTGFKLLLGEWEAKCESDLLLSAAAEANDINVDLYANWPADYAKFQARTPQDPIGQVIFKNFNDVYELEEAKALRVEIEEKKKALRVLEQEQEQLNEEIQPER